MAALLVTAGLLISGSSATSTLSRTSVGPGQSAKLTPSDATGASSFGTDVAISADGTTALVGGYRDNSNVGAAWVFTRSGTTWTQQAKLTGTGEAGAGEFGYHVALSADGNTALIGAARDNDGVGAAWVFTRTGTTWSQQGGKLTGAGEVGPGYFGFDVALSADGNTALVGGYQDNGNRGAAWGFTRSGATWTAQGTKLTGTGEVGGGFFGTSVALSADGNTALVAGVFDGPSGAVWPFTRVAGAWKPQGAKFTGTGGEGAGSFGLGLALSADGRTAIVTAPYDASDTKNVGMGAAWVFGRIGAVWEQQGKKLTGGGASGNAEFGWSVALAGDGRTALLSGVTDGGGDGATWTFSRTGSTWAQQGDKSPGQGGNWGEAVALSANGAASLVGAPHFGTTGGVFAFLSALPAVTGVSPGYRAITGGTPVTINGTGFTGATSVRFGTVAAGITSVDSDAKISVIAPPGIAGVVTVTVTGPTGTSVPGSAATFTYGSSYSATAPRGAGTTTTTETTPEVAQPAGSAGPVARVVSLTVQHQISGRRLNLRIRISENASVTLVLRGPGRSVFRQTSNTHGGGNTIVATLPPTFKAGSAQLTIQLTDAANRKSTYTAKTTVPS